MWPLLNMSVSLEFQVDAYNIRIYGTVLGNPRSPAPPPPVGWVGWPWVGVIDG